MTDPRGVVAGAVQTLAARRLGRAFVPLGLLAAAGVAGGLAGVWTSPVAGLLTVGAAAAAGALLVTGQRAVRRAFARAESGSWRWAPLARVVPWGWAVWVVAVPGVGAALDARARGAVGSLALCAATALLAVRVLVDAHRVGELERLAATMVVPAPDEEARG